MALPVSITLTLLVSYITFFMKKERSFLHNSIVFMVLGIITKNYISIMTMQLKLLKSTENPILFLYLLIDREIIIPLLIVIFLNLLLKFKTTYRKILLSIAFIGILQVLVSLMKYFGVVEFIHWNMYYALLINISYILIGLGLSKCLLFIEKRKGQKYDSYL